MATLFRRPLALGGSNIGAKERLTIITPVGPGHETILRRALKSVQIATATNAGPFASVEHIVIADTEGELGRGLARNVGIDDAKTDWLFFLDADDVMCRDALRRVDLGVAATFGAISKDGRRYMRNVWPCSWREIGLHGATGTLAMGFFCKREVADTLRFNDEMVIGEDYDFYMRLPSFTKVPRALVDIGVSVPSAGGPRTPPDFDGRKGSSNWTHVCNDIVIAAYDRDPERFGISRDALLAAAPRFARDPNYVPRLVQGTT